VRKILKIENTEYRIVNQKRDNANAFPFFAAPPLDLKKLPFNIFEYIEHLDELPYDPNLSPGIGN